MYVVTGPGGTAALDGMEVLQFTYQTIDLRTYVANPSTVADSSGGTTLSGFALDGHVFFANLYILAGALIEQDGFDLNGLKLVEIDTATNGTVKVDAFVAGILSSTRGYGANGIENYAHYYDVNGRLFEQDGFDANGVKTVEVYSAADGSRITRAFLHGALQGMTGYGVNGIETYAN